MKKSFLSLLILIASLAVLFSCGEEEGPVYSEPAPNHTHMFGEWRQIKAVDCYNDGLKSRSCSCGETEIEHITSFGHRNGPWIGVEPDCENSGYRSMSCTVCNKLLVDNEYVPAIGHEFTLKETVASTNDTAGYTVTECENCGQINKKFVEAFGDVHFRYEPIAGTNTCTVLGVCNDILVQNITVKDYVIPEYFGDYKVVAVAAGAFKDNTEVEKIIIPKTVETIGNLAFYGCTSLKQVYFGSSVKSIGRSLFEGCKSLEEASVPSNITVIPEYMFKGCTSLKTVSFSENVNKILVSAFEGCKSLEAVTDMSNVQVIGNNAFRECSSLKSVVLSGSLTAVGFGAFYNTVSLSDVKITDLREWFNINFANGDSNPLNGSAKLFVSDKPVETLEIPKGIVKIYDFAFYGYDHLKSVSIPKNVTYIGDYVFASCEALNKADVNASVEYLGNGLFYECKSLSSITLPGTIYAIRDSVFSGCSSLGRINVPQSLTAIGAGAFKNCTLLNEISLASVAQIESEAFSGCSALSSVTVSPSIRKIGNRAFADCIVLKAPELPEGLVSIGEKAFSGCVAFEEINIPSTLKSIGASAFIGCTAIAKINITDINHWCGISFGDINSNPMSMKAELYVNGEVPEYIMITASKISDYALSSCENIDTVYYLGTKAEFRDAVGNNNFLRTLYSKGEIYYYSNEIPDGLGRYWYYNDAGKICIW